jgi:hypothetical protein
MESYKNNESQEKLKLKQMVESADNWDDLREVAFRNSEIGKIYNKDRYDHLVKVAPDFMEANYSGGITEDGYLIDGSGNETSFHLLTIDDFPTEQEFFEQEKAKLLEAFSE